MIEIRITNTATTLTIGSWFGREKLLRIQIGSVSSPAPMVNVVTMISSKESAKASRAPATRARPHVRQRHPAERLPRRRAEVGRRLLERGRQPPQARDDVVVDDDDAEGRVGDDDREQARGRCPSTWVKVEFSAMPVTMPGQRDRQDDQERDRLAAEEAVARDRERGEGAEDQRDRGREQPGLHRVPGARRARPALSNAFSNHSRVKPGGGHSNVRASLNA